MQPRSQLKQFRNPQLSSCLQKQLTHNFFAPLSTDMDMETTNTENIIPEQQTLKRQFSQDLHGVTSQKMSFFINCNVVWNGAYFMFMQMLLKLYWVISQNIKNKT